MMAGIIVHCWEESPDGSEEGACLLRNGHSGDHEFTPDAEIRDRLEAEREQ